MKTKHPHFMLAINLFIASIISMQITSCNEISELEHLGFTRIKSIKLSDSNIDRDKLSNPEMMFANDSILVIHDLSNNKLFSSFELNSGSLINRFGEIGRGEKEILLGTIGYLNDSTYMTYNIQTNTVARYNPYKGDMSYLKLNFQIPEETDVSRIYIQNDSTSVFMGCYNGRYKYVKCVNNIIVDSLGLVSDPYNVTLNKSQRFLSEQVEATISPAGDKFAATTNFSDNIDFLSITKTGLKAIKFNHYRDATFTPETFGNNMNRMVPSDKEPIGFIKLTSNTNNVFALYAPHSLREGDYSSSYVLIYDWLGNPLNALSLSEPAYSIAANKDYLFAAVIDENGLFKIKKIALSEISN